MDPGSFNLRVYGIVINPADEVLLTDEYRFGLKMTKFPGGGLHFGEGIVDCLRREFREELGQDLLNITHFYTTEFFQSTALVSPPKQLISIYFNVELPAPDQVQVVNRVFDFDEIEGAQTFRWVPLSKLSAADVTYPIDKHVVKMMTGRG